MKLAQISVLVIALAFLLSACDFTGSKQDFTVLARVNNDILTLEEMQQSFEGNEWDRMTKDKQREHINQWVNLTIMANLAKYDEDIADNISLKFISENAEKKIYTNAIISKRLNAMKISEEELYNYYRLRQAEFIQSVREYKVQRIFFRTEEEMRRVKQLLDTKQIGFTPAAQQFSQENIGRNGGYMSSFVTKTGADSLLWRQLSTKEKFFEVTMRYADGWIIARYYDYNEGAMNSSFFDVRDAIEKKMKAEKQSDIYDLLLREAKINSSVVIEY